MGAAEPADASAFSEPFMGGNMTAPAEGEEPLAAAGEEPVAAEADAFSVGGAEAPGVAAGPAAGSGVGAEGALAAGGAAGSAGGERSTSIGMSSARRGGAGVDRRTAPAAVPVPLDPPGVAAMSGTKGGGGTVCPLRAAISMPWVGSGGCAPMMVLLNRVGGAGLDARVAGSDLLAAGSAATTACGMRLGDFPAAVMSSGTSERRSHFGMPFFQTNTLAEIVPFASACATSSVVIFRVSV